VGRSAVGVGLRKVYARFSKRRRLGVEIVLDDFGGVACDNGKIDMHVTHRTMDMGGIDGRRLMKRGEFRGNVMKVRSKLWTITVR
jgi:hypothetical protein